MPIKKITISEFITLSELHPVIDVRSPGEFTHAHFPRAYNIPLFSDEERKEIGTLYKQQGKQKAIKEGVSFFGPKMKSNIEKVEQIFKQKKSNSKTIILHCWRGGMRSAGMAWLFDLYGFDVYILVGGYKAYRKWVLHKFEENYQIKTLGGYTGSAKTELLHSLKENGESIIDLEALAHHKGSAFGGIGQKEQPTQEMFENRLANLLCKMKEGVSKKYFWLEDESQRIGRINIPHAFWKTIRESPLYFIDIPFNERLNFIIKHYGILNREELINSILRIQKRLGPNETKTSINFILEDNLHEAFKVLLVYYDKTYINAMNSRANINQLLKTINMENTDVVENSKTLLQFINQ